MSRRVVVLGAGFGGLELSATLSEALGDDAGVTLIDRGDAFVLGYSKLDLMFGRATSDAVRMEYRRIAMPGVRFRRETITGVDPANRSVTTDAGVHEADVLVIALGADYDFDATPGLAEGGNEFYTVAGAERLAAIVPRFSEGHALIGVCGAPIKCPPAPSECALLLHAELSARGVRDACRISFAIPFGVPVPPSPDASAALVEAFAERDIGLITESGVRSIDPERSVAVLDDGAELPFDLFLGVPKHRAPDVLIASGMTENGFVPVDPATLETRYPGVYAIGDVAALGVPKAGVFAEGAGRYLARALIAGWQGREAPGSWDGRGSCYVETGDGLAGRVDVEFRSGAMRGGVFNAPSAAIAAEKSRFGSSRRARWFGVPES